MNNQECKERPEIIIINNETSCSGSCNNINDPYAKLWVPDVVKNMNIKQNT